MPIKRCPALHWGALVMLTCFFFQAGCNSTDLPESSSVQTSQDASDATVEPVTAVVQDAKEVYSQALARAEQEKKNIFVHLSGPG